MRIFGGNIYEYIDGLFINASGHILTATDNFNNSGMGYKDNGAGVASDILGYISKVQGTSEKGFIPSECNGSVGTYFCDYGYQYTKNKYPLFGGKWDNNPAAGAFILCISSSINDSSNYTGARLMYL